MFDSTQRIRSVQAVCEGLSLGHTQTWSLNCVYIALFSYFMVPPSSHPCTHTLTSASLGAMKGLVSCPRRPQHATIWNQDLFFRLSLGNYFFQTIIQAQHSLSVALQIQQLESQVMDAEKRAFTAQQQVGFFSLSVCLRVPQCVLECAPAV